MAVGASSRRLFRFAIFGQNRSFGGACFFLILIL
tara:strand:+ start:503 stop:604 length:102 start_codon:yes stop_codon:yes gene_type:complete